MYKEKLIQNPRTVNREINYLRKLGLNESEIAFLVWSKAKREIRMKKYYLKS